MLPFKAFLFGTQQCRYSPIQKSSNVAHSWAYGMAYHSIPLSLLLGLYEQVWYHIPYLKTSWAIATRLRMESEDLFNETNQGELLDYETTQPRQAMTKNGLVTRVRAVKWLCPSTWFHPTTVPTWRSPRTQQNPQYMASIGNRSHVPDQSDFRIE